MPEIQIRESNLIQAIETACAFGTPSRVETKKITDCIEQIIEERNELAEVMRRQRNALAAWEDTAREAREVVDGIDPYDHGSMVELQLSRLRKVLSSTNNPPWKVPGE